MSIKKVQQFKVHLERLGYSKTTVQMLPACLKEFFQYREKTLEKITSEDINDYHEYLQERPNKRRSGGLSESYINHHIFSLKLFFRYQLELGEITSDPMSSLLFPSPSSPQREILTQKEIKKLYNAVQTLKDRAILSVYYGCGLRRIEGERLDLKDVKFRTGMLYVREGKGSKRRAVPMSKKVNRDIKNYVYKERFSIKEEKALFTNKRGTRSSGSSHNNALKKLLEKSGIKKEISLHCLRHSIATHLLENGLSVEYVRDFLGHKHLESTQIYTRVNQSSIWSLNSI